MIPLTPACLVAAAASFVGMREEGNNRGLMIDLFLRGVDQEPGQPWCAAFVHHIGYWSHFDYRSETTSWPLPMTASCYMLGAFARARGILMETPLDGDVFLVWNSPATRFNHTGVIAQVYDKGETPAGNAWFDCHTIEGNTNDDGGPNGWGVLRRRRRFYPAAGDRFIRWTNLEERIVPGSPLASFKRVA